MVNRTYFVFGSRIKVAIAPDSRCVFSAALRSISVMSLPLITRKVSDSKKLRATAKQPGFGNIEVLVQPANALKAPLPIDVVFTSQNYHDYNDPFMDPADVDTLNRQVFAALKPGGAWVIVDHVAEPGSGMRDTDKLHRIEPSVVRKQVEAAGFEFVAESLVLRNPKDGHKVTVFDPSIRRHTDQFAYKFRKPAK